METELTLQFKAKGSNVVKPSLVLIGLMTLFYLLSPIDIIPEQFVSPRVFGYIDDILVLTACVVYIFSNINLERSLENVRDIKVPDLQRLVKKDDISVKDKRNINVHTDIPLASSSVSSSDTVQTGNGDIDIPISIPVGSDATSGQDGDVEPESEDKFDADDENFFANIFSRK